jgi:hypothetical protein
VEHAQILEAEGVAMENGKPDRAAALRFSA